MKQRLRLWGSLLLLLVCAVFVSWFMLQRPVSVKYDEATQGAYLRGYYFGLEVADTPEERAKGLSGRDHIDYRQGMLFIFDSPGRSCFWMKDTLVPLDMLWFDNDYRLVHQELSVTPDTYPQTFCPQVDARYVVELRGGMAKFHGLQLGDELTLQTKQ